MADKKKTQKRGINKWIALMIGGAVFVAMLALLSPQIAVTCGGLMLIGGFTAFDQKRRGFWEQSISFKLKRLEEKTQKTAQDVHKNREEIITLKTTTAKPGKQPQTYKALAKEPPLPDYYDRLEALPRALKPGASPPPSAIHNDDHHDGLSDTVIREILHHAIRNDSLETFLQPIMRLPQRKIRFYEIFTRLRARPGSYIPATRFLTLAREDGLATQIDTMLLQETLKLIKTTAHLERAVPLFINVSETTLKNATFMNTLLKFIAKNRDQTPRLILEIPQAQFTDLAPAPLEIIRGLGKLGCAFSLDHVETLDLDIADLQRFKIRFIKLSSQILLQKMKTDNDFKALTRLKSKLESNSIGVIAEHVEREDQLRELLDYNIHYGQGFLFGRPDLQGAYKIRQVR